MTKPMTIAPHPISLKYAPGKPPEPAYTLRVNPDAAQAYGAKRRKRTLDGFACLNAKGQVDFRTQDNPPCVPMQLTKEEALSMAHQVGRYLMGFGDLVFAYTQYPEGWEE